MLSQVNTIWGLADAQDDGGFHVVVRSTMPEWAVEEAGAPAEVWLDIRSRNASDELAYDVIWVNKTATRLPEVQEVPCLLSGPVHPTVLRCCTHADSRAAENLSCDSLHCKALRLIWSKV